MTCFGSGQEKARSDAEFHVAMERLLLIQRKMEQESKISEETKLADQVAQLATFGDAERPGPDEIRRRKIADDSMYDEPIAGPEEIKRRKRIVQHIAGILLREKQGRQATKHGNFVLDWAPYVTWIDVARAKKNCPKSNPHQWIEDLIQEYQ
jgi:hypothetical protein